ncbi:MAG: hypothetical protein V3U19_03645 [Thermodesulfobacteriota bacterium]
MRLSWRTFFDINLKDIVSKSYSVCPRFWDPDFDAIMNQYRVAGSVQDANLGPDIPLLWMSEIGTPTFRRHAKTGKCLARTLTHLPPVFLLKTSHFSLSFPELLK